MKAQWARAILICACALLLSWPESALAQRADEDVAKALFQAGKAAYEAGQYADALKYFEQAYEQSKRPRMFYNIGQAADRLRNDERALEAFRRFLELVPDDPARPDVELRITALERSVAQRTAAQGGAPTPADDAALAPAAVADAATRPATPSETAYDPTLDAPADRPHDEGSVFGTWWFWTVTGVVVAGGATALVLVLSEEPSAPKPIAGEVGGVVQTLGRF
jgi:tetratricopeptide (TPR) repeat protein